ncbi:DUF4394 domain-containing protein [Candidatus Gracilibacteria bacterium]|nr:DUF4394 domain-containing protein [Candidatus Gracilibacteria bacterium]
MSRLRSFFRSFTGCALGLTLIASAFSARPAAAQSSSNLYVLTDNNSIALVSTGDLTRAATPLAVAGLGEGETLVAIDVRPQNGRLYGLATTTAGGLHLYHIDLMSGAAVATSLSGVAVQFDNGSAPVPVPGDAFGIDFNPTVDRLRIVSNGGLNARMNPNTGALLDGDNGGAAGSAPGVNPDGAINGPTTNVDDTAYTNSSVNASVTTQYTLDSGSNSIYIQTPPNSGTQTLGRAVALNGIALDFSSASGFDIPSFIAVGTANSPASGQALAALTVDGSAGLYGIELSNGRASLYGTFGFGGVRDIALAATPPAAIVLSADGTQLQRFMVGSPTSIVAVTISGIAMGETLVGIDGRPATGQLFGVGVNATANTATVYRIDPQTGAASAIGTPGQAAWVDANGMPIDLPEVSMGYGVDFNPTVDRIRFVNGVGLNARLNPLNGAAVDGDNGAAAGSVPGTNPDGALNGATMMVDATAYTNNFQGVMGMVRTTQYTLDAASNRLFIQNPPNAGVQTMALPVTLNSAALDFTAASGFDIAPGVTVATGNAPAMGNGFAALTVGGVTRLYAIDLATGAAMSLGAIGSGSTGAGGLVVWTSPLLLGQYLPIVRR